jgi:hypothetical protein
VANNFHLAVVGVSSSNVGSGEVEVWLPMSGILLWQQLVEMAFFVGGAACYTVPIPLTFGNLNNNVKIFVFNTLSVSIEIDIILDQEPNTPGVVVAGQTGPLTVRADYNNGVIPYCANLFVSGDFANGAQVLPAPSTGALFSWEAWLAVNQGVSLVTSAGGTIPDTISMIAPPYAASLFASSDELGPERIATGIWKYDTASSQTDALFIRYATGP